MERIAIGKIKPNPDNPRLIKGKSIVCQSCGIVFNSTKSCRSRTPKYCSIECYGKSLRHNKPCKGCGNIIDGNNGSISKRIFCSVECRIESRKGKPLTETWKKALSDGRKASLKCKGPNLYNWKGGKETEAERSSMYNKKRLYRMKAAGDLPFKYLKALRITQKNRCFYCEDVLRYDRSTHLEHLTPISKGGDNTWENLVLSCQRCNNRKKDKTLVEFAIKNIRPDWLNKSFPVQINAYRISTYIKA